MFALFSGLIAGTVHVVTGPDHLAAITPIALENPRRAVAIGTRWGLGHGLGAAALGGLGIVARSAINVDAISAWAEFAAGVTLLAVGLWSLRRALKIVVHAHGHDHHDGAHHHHYHVHAADTDHREDHAHRTHSHAAFFVGVLHGAAGTGHLLGVLPSLALPPVSAAIYLAAYFVAAVLSMASVGLLMGRWARNRGPLAMRRAMVTASSLAVLVGLLWIGHAWPG